MSHAAPPNRVARIVTTIFSITYASGVIAAEMRTQSCSMDERHEPPTPVPRRFARPDRCRADDAGVCSNDSQRENRSRRARRIAQWGPDRDGGQYRQARVIGKAK